MRTFCEISYRKKLQVEIRTCLFTVTLTVTLNLLINSSDVKSSRTSWPRGRNYVLGLGLEDLSSASTVCPRPVLELFILASDSWKCVK